MTETLAIYRKYVRSAFEVASTGLGELKEANEIFTMRTVATSWKQVCQTFNHVSSNFDNLDVASFVEKREKSTKNENQTDRSERSEREMTAKRNCFCSLKRLLRRL